MALRAIRGGLAGRLCKNTDASEMRPYLTKSQLMPTIRWFSKRFSDFGKRRSLVFFPALKPTMPNSVPLALSWTVMTR
ncbi:MAG: hypothetical protein QOG67_2316 [Verrucomicrobiota bacterium]